MDSISDIFAFAAKHVQYWDLLLPGEDDDLIDFENTEEQSAFEAARKHVQDSFSSLLLECLKAFQGQIPEDDNRFHYLRIKRPQQRTLLEKQLIELYLVNRPRRQVWLGLLIEPDFDQELVRLYARIGTRQGVFRDFRNALPPASDVIIEVDNNLYFGNLELTEGKKFKELANSLAELTWESVVKSVTWGNL